MGGYPKVSLGEGVGKGRGGGGVGFGDIGEGGVHRIPMYTGVYTRCNQFLKLDHDIQGNS